MGALDDLIKEIDLEQKQTEGLMWKLQVMVTNGQWEEIGQVVMMGMKMASAPVPVPVPEVELLYNKRKYSLEV